MTFVPPAGLGPFRFPEPWNSQAVRLTNASNAPQGCEPRGYSYWSCVSNHRGQSFLYVVLGRIGGRPILLRVDKATGAVTTVRELGAGNAEGWYFSDTLPHALYFLHVNGLLRYDVETEAPFETVFELNPEYGDDLWQAHSSADDTVHSATVRRRTSDGPYEVLGAVVFRNGRQTFFPKQGNFDECQIDKSGRWLVIQENDDDIIHDLATGTRRVIADRAGAAAHADCGDGLLVGEDNWHEAGALVSWDLADPQSQRRLVYASGGPSLGHVAVRGGRALLSDNATGEILDISLADGSSRRIAPGMIDGSDYDHQLRACWDPASEYACWIAEIEGRLDAILVHVGASGPIIVRPPDPKPQEPPRPGGPMRQLAIFTTPEDAHVELHHDAGVIFQGEAGTADGRPAHLLTIDGVPDGNGALLIIDWQGQTLEQRGILWLSHPGRGDRAEFAADDFHRPTASFR